MRSQFDKLYDMAENDPNKLEAYKILQQRVDLYFSENTSDMRRADAEINNFQRSLSGILITFSTFLITVSAFVLPNSKILHLSGYQKGFFITGISLLFASILFGIADFFFGIEYLKRMARAFASANTDLPPLDQLNEVKDMHEFRSERIKEVKKQPIWILYAQVTFLSLGFIFDFVLLITILFGVQ